MADNKDLTKWSFLPPILSANCVNDQTERPQIFIQNEGGKNKYYLFTISHQFTYAAGMRGPDGVYGFVGDGVRSDYQPMNNSGLALGSPTDLNLPAESPEAPTPNQNGRQFQAYSHYVQPGGLVQSFIDNVNGVRGGSLSPTVKINFRDGVSAGRPQLRPERPRPVRLPAHQRQRWRRRPLQVTAPGYFNTRRATGASGTIRTPLFLFVLPYIYGGMCGRTGWLPRSRGSFRSPRLESRTSSGLDSHAGDRTPMPPAAGNGAGGAISTRNVTFEKPFTPSDRSRPLRRTGTHRMLRTGSRQRAVVAPLPQPPRQRRPPARAPGRSGTSLPRRRRAPPSPSRPPAPRCSRSRQRRAKRRNLNS